VLTALRQRRQSVVPCTTKYRRPSQRHKRAVCTNRFTAFSYSPGIQQFTVPYEISGGTARVHRCSGALGAVDFHAEPNRRGSGRSLLDGTIDTAANPAKIGSYISLYATGEGQTAAAGVNGKLAAAPLPHPHLPVRRHDWWTSWRQSHTMRCTG